jgi:hypothetical protein
MHIYVWGLEPEPERTRDFSYFFPPRPCYRSLLLRHQSPRELARFHNWPNKATEVTWRPPLLAASSCCSSVAALLATLLPRTRASLLAASSCCSSVAAVLASLLSRTRASLPAVAALLQLCCSCAIATGCSGAPLIHWFDDFINQICIGAAAGAVEERAQTWGAVRDGEWKGSPLGWASPSGVCVYRLYSVYWAKELLFAGGCPCLRVVASCEYWKLIMEAPANESFFDQNTTIQSILLYIYYIHTTYILYNTTYTVYVLYIHIYTTYTWYIYYICWGCGQAGRTCQVCVCVCVCVCTVCVCVCVCIIYSGRLGEHFQVRLYIDM